MIVVLICLVCVLLSCTTIQDVEYQQELTVLNVAICSGKSNAFREILSDFSSENPYIKLKFIELDNNLEQYRLISAACSTGEYMFDIVEIEDTWVVDLAKQGYILPLSEKFIPDNSYLPCVRESFDSNGVTYAVPFQIDTGMMFSLKSVGWNGSFESLNGLKIVDNNFGEFVCTLMELINYTNNDVKEALRCYKKFYDFDANSESVLNSFEKGKLPIMHSNSGAIQALMSESSSVHGNFSIHDIPSKMVVPRIFGFAVSALTTKADVCEKFIEYFNREGVQAELSRLTGTYPVRNETYNNESIKSKWSHIEPKFNTISNAKLRPHIPDYAYNVLELRKCIEGYINGEITLDAAAKATEDFFSKADKN